MDGAVNTRPVHTSRVEVMCGVRPAARAVDEDTGHRCCACGKRGETQRCSRCRSAVYCSRECQKSDWGVHRKTCRSAKATKKQIEEDVVANGRQTDASADAFLEMSRLAAEAGRGGRRHQEIKMYYKMLKEFPDQPGTALNLTMAYHATGNREKAAKYAKICLETCARSIPMAEIIVEVADCLCSVFHDLMEHKVPALGLYQSLVRLLDSVGARMGPQRSAFLHFGFARALREEAGDLDGALAQLRCAIEHHRPLGVDIGSTLECAQLYIMQIQKGASSGEGVRGTASGELAEKALVCLRAAASGCTNPDDVCYVSSKLAAAFNIVNLINLGCFRGNRSQEVALLDEATGLCSALVAALEAKPQTPQVKQELADTKHFMNTQLSDCRKKQGL